MKIQNEEANDSLNTFPNHFGIQTFLHFRLTCDAGAAGEGQFLHAFREHELVKITFEVERWKKRRKFEK